MIMNILVLAMFLALMIGTIKMHNQSRNHKVNGDKSVVQFQNSVNHYLKGKRK